MTNTKLIRKDAGNNPEQHHMSLSSAHASLTHVKRGKEKACSLSAERERKTNKLRTVTRSVNLKQHVTPDPAELFGFSLENSQREHLTYGFFILLLQDVVVIGVFLRGLSAIIHGDHGEVGGHFLTM